MKKVKVILSMILSLNMILPYFKTNTAELTTFADETTYTLTGDVNNDNQVNFTDLLLLKKNVFNIDDIDNIDGDINSDGNTNIIDIVILKNILLSMQNLSESISIDDILKVYTGTYYGTQGITCLDLDVSSYDEETNTFLATFNFYAHESNQNVPTGSYEMVGTLNTLNLDGSIDIKFTGTNWIDKPTGYDIIEFIATIDEKRTTLKSHDNFDIDLTSETIPIDYSQIVNEYSGTYSAGQGYTNLDFNILSYDEETETFSATFSFYPNESNINVQSGSYEMVGTIKDTHANGSIEIEFIGTNWINQPFGYSMINFTAMINQPQKLLTSSSNNIRLTYD
ncbi:MAG: dockerin type I domain-containing protein [Oscillospiraceae bacterium]